MKTPLKISAGLIALYLVVKYREGAKTVINGFASGGRKTVKTFQGR